MEGTLFFNNLYTLNEVKFNLKAKLEHLAEGVKLR